VVIAQAKAAHSPSGRSPGPGTLAIDWAARHEPTAAA